MKTPIGYQDNAGFHCSADFMAGYNRRLRRQRLALAWLCLLALAAGLIYAILI
jgi:hypothetical protein